MVKEFEKALMESNQRTDGVCHCPYDEIEYLVGVGNDNEAVDVKTGRCLRCFGTRLGKYGIVLKGTRRRKDILIIKREVKTNGTTNN